jgi:hypothetical protein
MPSTSWPSSKSPSPTSADEHSFKEYTEGAVPLQSDCGVPLFYVLQFEHNCTFARRGPLVFLYSLIYAVYWKNNSCNRLCGNFF